MLKSLFIRNFVLIDSLDIKFDKGFSVITGETGAGKSIILGALSLVLGQRADGKSIKNGSEKCVISCAHTPRRLPAASTRISRYPDTLCDRNADTSRSRLCAYPRL